MFYKTFTSTIRAILRSRLCRISFALLFLFSFFLHAANKVGVPGATPRFDNVMIDYLPTVFNCVTFVFLYTAVCMLPIVAVTVTYDRDNQMYDVIMASRSNPAGYVAAKLLALLAVFYAASLLMLAVNFLTLYLFETDAMTQAVIPFGETLLRFAVIFLYYTVPVGLFFVSLVAAVTLLARRRVAGLAAGALYIIAAHFVQHRFFTLPPSAVRSFLAGSTQETGYLETLLVPDGGALTTALCYLALGLLLALLSGAVLPKCRKNLFA